MRESLFFRELCAHDGVSRRAKLNGRVLLLYFDMKSVNVVEKRQ